MIITECLRVTQIINCKRKLWIEKRGYKPLPAGYLAEAGRELHKAMEQHFKKDNGYGYSYKYSPVFKYPFNVKRYENFLDFVKGTIISEDYQTEIRLYSKLQKPVFSGKFDFRNGSVLYDFKSAKRVYSDFELQMGGYAVLLKENDSLVNSYAIVLLGNRYPMVVYLKPDIRGFKKEYEKAFETLLTDVPPEPDFTNPKCCFCEYVHHCKEMDGKGL